MRLEPDQITLVVKSVQRVVRYLELVAARVRDQELASPPDRA
jgi:hypothetical protein